MSDDELIKPWRIPVFTGDLGELGKASGVLKTQAGKFRDAGAGIHSQFQGLASCYHAPEADQLFATTAPVKEKSGHFADNVDKVSAALDAYAAEVKPLVDRLQTLREQADAFVASVQGDDDWKKDQKKVDRNNGLIFGVKAADAAFRDAERTCASKILALVGEGPLIPDDGSHKPNMYGYTLETLQHAEEVPWGKNAERELEGFEWAWHQVKSFVWDGVIVDGLWGNIRGLGTLVGVDGWDQAGEAWTNLGKLATGLVITVTPAGAAFWTARDDQLPSWLRDSRQAVKQTGKAMVAYDEWDKNPARAAGAVSFNVVSTVLTAGAGAAAKGGAVVKALSTTGKVARAVDPLTYLGKAGSFGVTKVGDLMGSLKNLDFTMRMGASVRGAEGALKGVESAAFPSERFVQVWDHQGKPAFMEKESGKLSYADGAPVQAARSVPHEVPASERVLGKTELTTKEPVLAGGGGGSDAQVSVGQAAEHIPGGTSRHAPGGSADYVPRGPADKAGGRPSANYESPTGPRNEAATHEHPTSGGDAPGVDTTHSSGPAHSGHTAESSPGENHSKTPGATHDAGGEPPHPTETGPHAAGAGWVTQPSEYAGRIYEQVRATPNKIDLPVIAKNTGIDEGVLRQVKSHLFRSQHDVPVGPGEVKRGLFEPRDDIADLWQDAHAGTLDAARTHEFRSLMAHEYIESRLMKAGLPYTREHPSLYMLDEDGTFSRRFPQDVRLAGAHELAPHSVEGHFNHWKRAFRTEPPGTKLAEDLSNIDEVVKDIVQKLRSKGLEL
ncbi:hypothetical protein ACFP1Z_05120 [Streptomyces gamaensis]|uniref:Protein phosphatase n=1 Tax=Streptomyces gamaensis TaxID=1763542 RepID=A0ABW0YY05_9ACTN